MNIRKEANPLDIIFREKKHTYSSAFNPNHVSVTTVLKDYQQPFDVESILPKYAKKNGYTEKYVRQKWDDQRNLGTEIGSWLHIQLENQLQNKVPDLSYLITKEPTIEKHFIKQQYLSNYHIQIAKYLKFVKDQTYLGSEIIVGNEKNAGQIDTLFLEGIDDFKNDKNIDFESWSYTNWQGEKISKKMLPPFQDLDDCNWNKYCLQINFYHFLLPEEVKAKFTRLHRIIKFDRYSQDFEVHEVPDWQERIKQLYNDIKRNSHAIAETTK
jgi:hypothetical protein